jgi:hypothetical protein
MKTGIQFPFISAATADALAYQFEVGSENHSCPVENTAIAFWLRDMARQLREHGEMAQDFPLAKAPEGEVDYP